MKKISVLLLALALVFGAQAQFGRIGNAVKKGVEKGVEKTVEKKAQQKAEQEVGRALDNAFGIKQQPTEAKVQKENLDKEDSPKSETKEGQIPTPEEVMATVPQLPSYQNIAEYLCEQNRENPRTLKMLTNPMTKFLTQMGLAAASGYVTMMSANGTGALYYYDEALLEELGIEGEKYENMSEKEKEALAQQYAAELQERYMRTAEMLGSDDKYQKMLNDYTAIDKEIEEIYNKAEESCKALWSGKYAGKSKVSENDMCDYYGEAVPVYYKAITEAMKIRKDRQLGIAKDIDTYVQDLAKERRGEVYAGFYNQGGLCATSYVADAARLMSIPDPR